MGNRISIYPDLLVTGIMPVAGEYDGIDLSKYISFEKGKVYSKCELLEFAFNVPDNISQANVIHSFLYFLVECFYNSNALQEAVDRGYIADIIYDEKMHQHIMDESPNFPITGIKPVAGEFDGKDLSSVFLFEKDEYYDKKSLKDMLKEVEDCIDQFYNGAAFPHFINIFVSDDRPCLEDFGAIECILIDAAAFLRYLIECFDDPKKLQEAWAKGYIVNVLYGD